MLHRNAARLATLACLLFGIASSAVAQTDESLLLLPWKEGRLAESTTDLLLYNSSHLDRPDENTSFFQIESTGRYRLDTARELNPTVGYDWTHIGTDVDLIPSSLDNITVAIGSPLAKVGDWFIGATAGFGYAGPAAFGDGRAWYAKGSVMSGTKFDSGDALVLLIDYDGDRTWFPDVPLPGLAYSGTWGQEAKYVVGIPINALVWTPTEQLKFTVDNYLFVSFDAAAEYKLTSEWTLFARYADHQNAFFDSDLPEDRRLFYNEARIEGGVGYNLNDYLGLELGIGYAFNREFTTGFDERDLNKVADVSSEPYVRLGLAIRY